MQHAKGGFHRGGFAGTVRADDDRDFTLVHRNGAVMQDIRAGFAIPTGHAVADQKGLIGAHGVVGAGRNLHRAPACFGDRGIFVAAIVLVGIVAHAPTLSLFFRPVPR